MIALVLLEVCCFDEAGWGRVDIDEFLQNDATLIKIALSLLKLEVRVPSELRRLPSHPVLKDPPDIFKLPEHLLH